MSSLMITIMALIDMFSNDHEPEDEGIFHLIAYADNEMKSSFLSVFILWFMMQVPFQTRSSAWSFL